MSTLFITYEYKSDLVELQELILSFNHITLFPDISLPHLTLLEINNNLIKEIPQTWLLKLPELEHADLSHNQLHCLSFTGG